MIFVLIFFLATILMASFEASSIPSFTEGWYSWSYAGGSFPVSFRPYGSFHCPEFPAQSRWSTSADKVIVDWGSYGKYELAIGIDPVTNLPKLEGFAAGNPNSWRKATFVRDLSPAEQILCAGGSEWKFEYEKGSFMIEFRGDGMNHFICKDFPAHAHWSMDPLDNNKISIDWSQYGKYDMILDPNTRIMNGCKRGQPSNWRRATFVRSLGEEGITSLPAHDHSHGHVHDENCDHKH